MRMISRRSMFYAGVGALVFALALAGCASPPVQAMSNARQAIAAAEQAGAALYAPQHLAQARHWLDDAETSLKSGNYNRAGNSAQRAEKLARKAAAESRLIHAPPAVTGTRPSQPERLPAAATATPPGSSDSG